MDACISKKILELLTTGSESIFYIQNFVLQGKPTKNIIEFMDNILDLIHVVEHQIKEEDLPNRVSEINLNIDYYIAQMKQELELDIERFLYNLRYHLKSLFRVLEFEVAYVLEGYIDKSEYPHFYPEVERIEHQDIVEQGAQAVCQASVVLLAYNNLEYVRNCVESILAHTEDVEYELILVDNGSSDGTREYFESIEGAKVIHLEYNLHVVKGFNIGLMAAEGKYCAAVCNDFIFAPNWLRNLMICIESDAEIGFVSPGATSISNDQQIDIPFSSITDFTKRAGQYNVSNPRKWQERVVLLPNVLCCPTALLERIGYYDTRYYRGEFLDDDISFRIRRAGYKLIYCGDTVTHHYGSLTTSSDHQNNSLEEGRKIFLNKYGLDAWNDARMDMAYYACDFSKFDNVNAILGVNVKCGATLLQLKNKIWNQFGISPEITAVTTESKYLIDLQTISDVSFSIRSLQDIPREFHGKFDLVFIEQSLNDLNDDLDAIFFVLKKLLRSQGHIILKLDNCASITNIFELIQSAEHLHRKKIFMPNPFKITAEKNGFTLLKAISLNNHRNQSAVEKFSRLITSAETERKHLQDLLKRDAIIYQFFK